VNEQDGLTKKIMGARIRQMRESQGMSKEELAERIDIGIRHMNSVELGEKGLSIEKLYRLIRVLNVSADFIFFPELYSDESELENLKRSLARCTPKQRHMIAAFIDVMLQEDQE